MSITLERIRRLVQEGAVRVSENGYDELSADAIFAREVIVGIADAILVEDYPEYPKGPCVPVYESFKLDRTVRLSGITTQLRGINTQYEHSG